MSMKTQSPDLNQLNTYGRFWSGAWDSVFHHRQQNTKWWNFSWWNDVASLQ
jgi:hypothetical protein